MKKLKFTTSFLAVAMLMIALDLKEQFFIIFLIVTLHEFTHVFFAKLFGLKIKKITFLPMGEVAEFENIEVASPFKRFIIFVSGPLMNLIIGMSTLFFVRNKEGLLYFFAMGNMMIGTFNLIPAFPFDGGRILQMVLGNLNGILNANKIIVKISSVVSWILVLVGILQVVLFPFNISIFCCGIYLRKIIQTEKLKMTFEFYKNMVAKSTKIKNGNIVKVKTLVVAENISEREIVQHFSFDYYHMVYMWNQGEIKKVVTEEEIVKKCFEG